MTYLISKFLNKKQLSKIYKILDKGEWKDGAISLTLSSKNPNKDSIEEKHKLKKTTQFLLPEYPFYEYVDYNKEFYNFTLPKSSTTAMATRTPKNGYYHPHFDNPSNGDFSTTIFLNDPSSYEGGELGLWINNKEENFKLKPGYGITYKTGTGHHVHKVTKGRRDVIVFWTHTQIPNLEDLRKYRKYNEKSKKYESDNSYDIVYTKLEDFVNDKSNYYKNKCDVILRQYHMMNSCSSDPLFSF